MDAGKYIISNAQFNAFGAERVKDYLILIRKTLLVTN